MPAIYRKYRPQNFSDVVGQDHIKLTLGNQIAQGDVPHAMLFVGPRGTGKTTLARLVARAINCETREQGAYEPCNVCPSCIAIRDERSLDIVEIDAATHTQVDNVRDNIISNIHVPPISPHGYKVFIIDEIHMLSKHAFNALLKTIEEPPVKVVFIFATTDAYKVPETIVSRCQRFDFKKISQQLIIDRLNGITNAEQITVPESVLARIAHRSGGCLRDAESLLGQLLGMAEDGAVSEDTAAMVLPRSNWQQLYNLLSLLAERNLADALNFLHEALESGLDPEDFMNDSAEFIRLVLLSKATHNQFVLPLDERSNGLISDLANRLSLTDIRRMLEIFLKEALRQKNSSILELPIEMACIEFCSDTSAPQRNPVTPTSPDGSASTHTKDHALRPEQGQTTDKLDSSHPDLPVLKQHWEQILEGLKSHNHSLSVFLKVAHPVQISDQLVILGFKFDFHAKTVREPKNRIAAENALSQALGRPITLDCIVDSQYTENHKIFNGGTEPEVQDILQVMGGGELV